MVAAKIIKTYNDTGLSMTQYVQAKPEEVELFLIESSTTELVTTIALLPLFNATKAEVREAWRPLLATGSFYLEENGLSYVGKHRNEIGFLSLLHYDTGRVVLTADFKNSICSGHTWNVGDDYSRAVIELKRLGFGYHNLFRRWVCRGLNHIWRVERIGGEDRKIISRRLLKRAA